MCSVSVHYFVFCVRDYHLSSAFLVSFVNTGTSDLSRPESCYSSAFFIVTSISIYTVVSIFYWEMRTSDQIPLGKKEESASSKIKNNDPLEGLLKSYKILLDKINYVWKSAVV